MTATTAAIDRTTPAPEPKPKPATLGEALARPSYLFSRWPWVALGNIIVGLLFAWALSGVLLVLLVLSLVPQIRALLWPNLLRAEVWRLRLIDRPGADALSPPIDAMADRGDTPTFAQFAHLALVLLLFTPLTIAVAMLPLLSGIVVAPWTFFDVAAIDSLPENPTDGQLGQSLYDSIIAPLPTWALATWIIVAGIVMLVTSLYIAGLWAWATGKLGRRLMAPDEEQLRADLARVRESRSDVLDAAALERTRIEGALHDGVQHRLVALTMKLGIAHAEDPESDAGRLAGEVHREVDAILGDLRGVIRNIQPRALSEHGLRAAVADLAAWSPVPVNVDIPSVRLPRHIEEAAFFITSEALSNVAKHSGATLAHVTADIGDGTLHLSVTDDGCGGALDNGGLGMRGMRQRAAGVDGAITVASPAGGGTTVTLTCPIPDPAEQPAATEGE